MATTWGLYGDKVSDADCGPGSGLVCECVQLYTAVLLAVSTRIGVDGVGVRVSVAAMCDYARNGYTWCQQHDRNR